MIKLRWKLCKLFCQSVLQKCGLPSNESNSEMGKNAFPTSLSLSLSLMPISVSCVESVSVLELLSNFMLTCIKSWEWVKKTTHNLRKRLWNPIFRRQHTLNWCVWGFIFIYLWSFGVSMALKSGEGINSITCTHQASLLNWTAKSGLCTQN